MADKTINQLTEDTSPTSDDYVPSWDAGTGTTKKITLANLLAVLKAGLTGFAWASWTPSFTNVTVGNGVLTFKYGRLGNAVFYKGEFDWGTTSSEAGSPIFTLPTTSVALTNTGPSVGTCRLVDSATWHGPIIQNNTTSAIPRWYQVSGTGIKETNLASTSPDTWDSTTFWYFQGFYESA